jgi:hypothetical protein
MSSPLLTSNPPASTTAREGTGSQLHRRAFGEQLPAVQEHAEAAEFQRCVACCRRELDFGGAQRAIAAEGRLGAGFPRHHGPPAWMSCNLAPARPRVALMVAKLC